MANLYGGYNPMQGGYMPPQGGPPQQQGWAAPAASPVNPEVAAWFYAVDVDRSGQITATELQQALTNANWTHFNAETCRLMIGMFDRDHSGKIDINEFQSLWTYIMQWKGIFEQYDHDRSGAIDGNELCRAFNTLGYRVSPQFSQIVVMKYDLCTRRTLSLDNFIQACVLLRSVTDNFRMKDTMQNGTIRISYEEFMTMCLLNRT